MQKLSRQRELELLEKANAIRAKDNEAFKSALNKDIKSPDHYLKNHYGVKPIAKERLKKKEETIRHQFDVSIFPQNRENLKSQENENAVR